MNTSSESRHEEEEVEEEEEDAVVIRFQDLEDVWSWTSFQKLMLEFAL